MINAIYAKAYTEVLEIIKHFQEIYKLAGNNNPPQFDCTNCDGKLIIVNTMDI